MSLNGIDTSKWQSGLPDATINADFIIFKATEGVGYVDPDCNPSYQESKAAGKLLGVYHFARPDGNDPISEANFFVDNIQGYIGEAILVLDWEVEPKNNVNWAKQWLDHVYARTGVRPLIYMSESVVNSYDWSSVANANYGLWVARYRDYEPDYNYNMAYAGQMPDVKWWKDGYCMWQWTSSGRLDGWAGNLDCNIFYGDANTWKAYATSKPVVGNPPVVTPVVEAKTETRTEPIAYGKSTITAVTNDKSKAGTVITQKGINGIKTFTYTVTYIDGKETARSLVSEIITTQPVIEITTVTIYVEPVSDIITDINVNTKETNSIVKENNSILKKILEILTNLVNKITSVFK